MSSKQICFEDLPPEAQAGFSDDQLSYIDEFTFYYRDGLGLECHYAGEVLAVWDGYGWQH